MTYIKKNFLKGHNYETNNSHVLFLSIFFGQVYQLINVLMQNPQSEWILKMYHLHFTEKKTLGKISNLNCLKLVKSKR